MGAYYDENELDMEGQVGIDTNFDGLFPQFAQVAFGAPFPNLLTLLTGGAYGSDQISRNHNFNQETESWAVFAQGTFEITDSLRVTGGLRYTEEEKSLVFDQTNTAFTGHPNISARPSIDDSGVSGNISLSYATENVSYYASVGRGFKSGGFNPDIVPNDEIGFDEETVISYEIGAKSTLVDGRVGLNLSLIHI